MYVRRLLDPRSVARGLSRADAIRRLPIIVANPSNDAAFRVLIGRLLFQGVGSPGELETALRTRFPDALVRPRGLAGEPFEVWYVYREGHWIRSDADAKR